MARSYKIKCPRCGELMIWDKDARIINGENRMFFRSLCAKCGHEVYFIDCTNDDEVSNGEALGDWFNGGFKEVK